MKRIIVVLMAVVLACLSCQPKERAMAIQTDGSEKYIQFSGITTLSSLNTHSISMFLYQTAYNFTYVSSTGEAKGLFIILDGGFGNGAVVVASMNATTQGIWKSATGVVGLNTLYNIIVTYDSSSVGNDPILYVNNNVVSLTEFQTPVGAFTGSSNLLLGGRVGDSVIGNLYNYRYYNRILTPAEVATIYNMRGKDNIIYGLVFHPMLKGAAGLSTFDGATLADGNTIYDPYSQTYGVPVGSPIAVADNVLGW